MLSEICTLSHHRILLHHPTLLTYCNPISEVSGGMDVVYLDPLIMLHPLCNSIMVVSTNLKTAITCATGSTPDTIPHNSTIMENYFSEHIHHVPLYRLEVIILMLISPMLSAFPWWWSFNLSLSTLNYIRGPLTLYSIYMNIFLSVVHYTLYFSILGGVVLNLEQSLK